MTAHLYLGVVFRVGRESEEVGTHHLKLQLGHTVQILVRVFNHRATVLFYFSLYLLNFWFMLVITVPASVLLL